MSQASHSGSNIPVSGEYALPFDPTLLQPIVRSKRTPIACTECRRRQVKCSGKKPRCERCDKKGIDCEYVPLSEQRAGGGSISRSGTPQHALANHGHGHSSRYPHAAAWQHGVQGYHAGSGGVYPASAQGWRPTSPASATYGTQSSQSYAGVAYPAAAYDPHTGYVQGEDASLGASAMHAEGYAQQGYANEAAYDTNTFGHHGVPATDPRYAYASQMGAMGDHQQSTAYVDQYGQQVFIDQATGQLISAEVASQWVNNHHTGFQGQHYPSQN